MPSSKNLIGRKFGRLTVKSKTDKRDSRGMVIWECECDCGKIVEVRTSSLISKNTTSCGCYKKEFDVIRGSLQSQKYLLDGTRVNSLNDTMLKNNTSGIKGVSLDKRSNKYEAYIEFQGIKRRLGLYKKLEDAAKARKLAEELYFEPIIEKYKKEAGA